MTDVKDGTAVSTTYGYDSMNRLTGYTQDGSYTSYSYDGSGNRTKVSYSEGNSMQNIEYKYDVYNRLQDILLNGNIVRDYSYTASGKVGYINNYRKFDTAGSDYTRIRYTYNGVGAPSDIVYLDNNSVRKEEYTLGYDKRGYIKTETAYTNYDAEKTVNKSYSYDEIGRLLSAANSTDSTTTNYSYDKVGNRLTMNDGKDSYTYSYNQFNSLLETKKNGSTIGTYTYDANGNQIKDVSKKDINGVQTDVTTTYGYDKADRLISLTIFDGISTKNINNTFNGDGQRIRQTQDGVTTKYYYDGDSLLYTSDINNNRGIENILDPAGTIAASKRFDGNYANMYFFYNYDIRGSVTSILKPDGSLVKGYSYDEFGNTKETGEVQFKNDAKFTGAVHDTSAGLYYMNSRFYNPNTGRFLSQDTYSGNPYDPWTQHLYSYTSNNPVNFIDPTGHMMLAAVDGVSDGGSSDRNVGDKPVGGQISSGNLAQRLKVFKGDLKTKFLNKGTAESETEVTASTQAAAEAGNSRIFTTGKTQWTATRSKGTQQTYNVYQRNDIDWDMIRTSGDKNFIGKTNAEAAKNGLAPQLSDGNFATLHHIGQDSRGALAEASTRYHGVGKYGQDILHSQYGRNTPNPYFPIDRSKFGVDTREYWQWRVEN